MSRWRPKAFTTAWPVNVSSMSPFSCPVVRHWSMNFARDLAAIFFMVSMDDGITRRATSASCHDTVNIITMTPTMVRSDVMSWLRDCWRLWLMLSMSFVTRLSSSPRECLSM